MKKTMYFSKICLIAGSLLLSGCNMMQGFMHPSNNYAATGPLMTTRYTESVEHYLQMANSTSSPEREQYRLLAVGRLLQDGSHKRAKQILKNTNDSVLTVKFRKQKRLFESQLALIDNRPQVAISKLAAIKELEQLSKEQQIQYHQQLAQSYLSTKNPYDSAKEYIKLDHLLKNPELSRRNRRRIWRTLTKMDEHALHALMLEQKSGELRSWIELVYIEKHLPDNSQKMIHQLHQWQQNNPNHPGNSLLPNIQPQKHLPEPKQIALLVPTHGNLAGPGNAIRDGFMAAYFQDQKFNPNNTHIRIYDTSTKNAISSIYQKAVNEGADFVVGPLRKLKVKQLVKKQTFPIPTLTLNYDDKANAPANLFQFGISPLEEAWQVADKAWQDGHREAIVISPSGQWGNNIANAFIQRWKALGGKTVGQLNYDKNANLRMAVKQLLHIDRSNDRKKTIETSINQKIKFIPRRRQDADMIFLAAMPNIARQIRPLLRFYYAGRIPTYATSLVYAGTEAPRQDKDIDGVIFCDMPWVFNEGSTIQRTHNKVAELWPTHFNRYTRLYALGLDAYKIAKQLPRLSVLPQLGIPAATGTLYLDRHHHIRRELQWAQFRHGSPFMLTPTA